MHDKEYVVCLYNWKILDDDYSNFAKFESPSAYFNLSNQF